ncbi:glucans biosynthesis glucosyltransferase MdoH [Flavisphingomonas formosensis]|uniref:glucans biosynthesis glucosyltransferase MdoH n=1 Tax=Flavisphingomonas formosensis TaxID=861534 RepID=UPI0012FB09D3|nr:glucans biosynthesis glucosyltransferase MdoH [Sphingomonas formosensis]
MSNHIPLTAPHELAGDLPHEAPMAMPTQSFADAPATPRPPATSPRSIDERRALLIVGTIVVTLFASADIVGVAAEDGISLRELGLILLFCPLFAWIAFAFSTALAGYFALRHGGTHESLRLEDGGAPRERTAVLVPIYNEDVDGVMKRVRAMMRSVASTGHGAQFDFFILSDSTDPAIRVAEHAAFEALRQEAPLGLYYRLRPQNLHRKPGNIAEWISRFGNAYEHMIVLDADSLMSGEVMNRLALTMEAHPGVALIQTLPSIIGSRTLFARWQQFAARLYSPVSSAGLLWWSGAEATFWGHNAIIRTRAFAQCCGLPTLPGRKPFGGAIMSHDLVEAAMLRRHGWAVHMVEVEEGSYEEYPPTAIDHAIRDRRWCQGNIQHLRLLGGKGFHWASRFQLLIGGSAYLTSPLWLMMLIAGSLQQADANGRVLLEVPQVTWVFTLTFVLLFGPKLLSVAWVLGDPARRAAYGGAERIIASVMIEIPLAVLLAPMVMMTQTLMLIDILRGRDSGWKAQCRDADGLSFGYAFRFYRWHVLTGIAMFAVTLSTQHQLLWTAPVALSLIAAPLLAMISARRDIGMLLMRDELLLTPEEWRGLGRSDRRPAEITVNVPAALTEARAG